MSLKVIRRRTVNRATNLVILVAFLLISIPLQPTEVSAALAPNAAEPIPDNNVCMTGGPGCGPRRIGPQPQPPACQAGTLPGQAGVTCTGAGTYGIPIDVPPGSADMQPALSLVYNSQAGNGLLGMGWSINGLSSITRCAANMAMDGYRGGINYDEDDKFCLDGQRLVPITPINGSGVREYRTEPETFTRVKSFGTTATGADYFTAEAKSGLMTEYGNTPDSFIEPVAAVAGTVFPASAARVWAANKLSSRVGNYIEYVYNEDLTTGEYSPAEIRYTGNANTVPATVPYNFVKFDYEPRFDGDSAIFYQGGSFVKMTFRLKSIRTCLSEACGYTDLVTHYKLEYQTGPATNRVQLKSLEQCDADQGSPVINCLPKTTMTWSDQGVTSLAGNRTSGNYGMNTNAGRQWNSGINDFAGDDSTFMKSAAPIYLDALVTSVKGIINAPDVGSVVNNSFSLVAQLASIYSDPYGAIFGRILGYLRQWFTDLYWIAKGKVGDVNGDGRTDIVGLAKKNGDVDDDYVWLSKKLFNGKNEFVPQDTAPLWETKNMFQFFNEATESDEAKLADFNGDGLMDVLSFEEKNATTPSDAYVYLSNGVDSFDYAGMHLKAVGPNERKAIGHSALGDFNGDGKSDFAQFTVENNIFQDDVYGYIHLAQGNTFVKMTDWGRLCETFGIDCKRGDYPLEDVTLGDVNGDGKTDVVVYKEVDDGSGSGSEDTHAYIYLTNKDANGWVTGSPVDFNFGYDLCRDCSVPTVILPGDFNGDGKMDLAYFTPNTIGVRIPDTNHSGDEDNGDIRMYNGGFDVYLSTGKTFLLASSFDRGYEDFTGQNAPFAIGPRNPLDPDKYIQYAEGSDLWFLPRLGDFNGDGKTDIIIFDSDNDHNAHLWLSDGSRLRPEINWGSNFGLIDEDTLGDFDGDGRTDVLQFAHGDYSNRYSDSNHYDGQLNVTLSNSYPFPDLMIRVTNGFGKKDEFEYKPLTDNDVYKGHTPIVGVDSEIFNFRGSLYVVSKLKTSNGILPITPEGLYTLDYQYYGAKSHRSHGFLGFSKIINLDSQKKTTETTEYEQTYPLNCRVKSKTVNRLITDVQTTANSSSSLSEHTSTWSFTNGTGPGGMPHVIKLDAETDIQYEIGGVELSNSRIEYMYEPDYPYNLKFQRTTWPDQSLIPSVEDITNEYDDIMTATTWILGLPTSTTVKRFEPVDALARTVNRAYNSSNGLLTALTEVLQGGIVTINFPDYDEFGNPKRVEVSGSGIETRTTNITYDSKGRFPATIQNPFGPTQTTNATFEPEFGNLVNVTDPNGLSINRYYDGFGRDRFEQRPDGTTTLIKHCFSPEEGAYAPSHAVHWIKVITAGVPDTTVFYDKLGREIRTSTVGFSGTRIYSDSSYDNQFRLQKVSQPYYKGALSSWTEFAYDVRDRRTSVTAPNGAVTSYSYTGNVALGPHPFPNLNTRLLWHQITEQNALGEKTDYTINRLDQVNQIAHRDPGGVLISHMTYNDDAFNNPLGTADENGNIIFRTYENDRMISQSDPDLGTSTYTYDVLGNLASMTDPKGNDMGYNVTFTYDLLDRLTMRTEPEGTTAWVYGTDPTLKNIGRLQGTSSGTGPTWFTETYLYDNFGRPWQTWTQIPGTAPVLTERTYDTFGRVATLKYPGDFTIRNEYNLFGYLSAVRNDATNALFWQANALNAAGQVTSQTQGSTQLMSKFTYDKMFHITNIKHGSSNNGIESVYPLKQLTYMYNSTNNLMEQRNLIRAPLINEDYLDQFDYDPLNRLKRKFGAIDDHIQQIGIPRDEFTYEYDAIGNITYKSDLGSPMPPNYFYPPIAPGPHAVSAVEDNQMGYLYTYDLNGNMLTGRDFQNGEDRAITWYSYNKPYQISEIGKLLTLTYDSYRDKIRQVLTIGGNITTTEYIGSIYEKVTSTSGPTEHKYYIYGNSSYPVAMYTTRTPLLSNTRYFHYDNLGSLDLITDETGGIIEDLSYDPHGVRRNPDWTVASGPISSLTAHGFTNQEHLDDFGLIDMKGRMFDPKIGRFISADPFITNLFMTENLNRYSYVHNSPTNFIDPTGFQLCPGPCGSGGGGGGGGGGIGGAIVFGVISGIGQAAFSDSGITTGQYTHNWGSPSASFATLTPAPSYSGNGGMGTSPNFTHSMWEGDPWGELLYRFERFDSHLDIGNAGYPSRENQQRMFEKYVPDAFRLYFILVLSPVNALETITTGRDLFDRGVDGFFDRYFFPAFELFSPLVPKYYRGLTPKNVKEIETIDNVKTVIDELGPKPTPAKPDTLSIPFKLKL